MKLEEKTTSITKNLSSFITSPQGSGLGLTITTHGTCDIRLGGGGSIGDMGCGLGIRMHRVGGNHRRKTLCYFTHGKWKKKKKERSTVLFSTDNDRVNQFQDSI